MVAEAGHHSNRCYIGQDGNLYLNGCKVYDPDGNDISASLAVLDTIAPAELGFLDGVTAGVFQAGKALVLGAGGDVKPALDDTGTFAVGDGTTDMDFKVFLGAAGDYVLADVGAKALTVAGAARLLLNGVSATGVTDGSVIRMGTSGSPLTDDQAGAGFVVGWFDSGATSGWPAGQYIHTAVTGAGGSFTALQGDATVSAAKAVVTGIENFLAFTGAGCVTGGAVSVQGTVDFSNAALAGGGGWYRGAIFSIKGEGASCDPTAAALIANLEIKTDGTWATAFESLADSFAIVFNGFTSASGTSKILSSSAPNPFPTGTYGIRVGANDGGVDTSPSTFYIPLLTAADWAVNRLDLVNVSAAGVTDGSVIRMGTSGSPLTDDQAGTGFVVGYFDCGATSGWPAAMYITTNVTGAGGSFTALEGDAVISAAKETVTGIECFMQFVTPGKVTGAARACQATIDFGNYQITAGGGVYSAATFNIKGEGAACDPSLAQRMSCLELKTEGTFAATKDFEKAAAAYAIYFNGFTGAAGTGSIISSTRLAELPAGTIGFRIGVGADGDAGTPYYVPAVPAGEWN